MKLSHFIIIDKKKNFSKIFGNMPNIHNEKSCLIAHFSFQLYYAYFKLYARKFTDQMNEHQKEDYWIRVQQRLIISFKMDCLLHNKDPMSLVENMDSYFKNTPPDCSLFSKENHKILVHKELLYQTKVMREMIKNVGIDSKIEVICTSLSKEELEIIINFFYDGKILCTNQIAAHQAKKDLEDIFGFPLIQDEISVTTEPILLLSPRNQPRKQSLNFEPIKNYYPETTIKIENDVDDYDNEVSFVFVIFIYFKFLDFLCDFSL